MPIPKDKSIEIYLLHEIGQMGGSVRRSDPGIYQRVAQHFPQMNASDLQLTDAASGTNKFQKHVEFAASKVRKNGELDGSIKGVWSITPKGRDRVAKEWPPSEPPEYSTGLYIGRPRYKKASKAPTRQPTSLQEFRPSQALQPEPSPSPVDSSRATSMSLANLVATHLDELKRGLADRMASLSADQFEEFVAEFLKRLGYAEVRRVGGPGDRNIDVTASYPAPFIEVPIRVQVKHRRTSPNVGPTDVAAFRDRAGGADHLLLMVTNADFTGGAEETASEPRRQLVHLVDGKGFINSMIDKRIGVVEGAMGVLEIDEDFWNEF